MGRYLEDLSRGMEGLQQNFPGRSLGLQGEPSGTLLDSGGRGPAAAQERDEGGFQCGVEKQMATRCYRKNLQNVEPG